MNKRHWSLTIFSVLMLIPLTQVPAEPRRPAGDDVLRKAQYMIRQLNQEKTELQQQLAQQQAKTLELEKQLNTSSASLKKSKTKNEKLVGRVKSDRDKFNTLLERYRDTVKTLRLSNTDNQYLVKAVQEREQWVTECRARNDGLFAANTDLLTKYKKAATRFSEPLTGLSTVKVENETQEYRFKLEDLQVTTFKPIVDPKQHMRQPVKAVGDDKISSVN